jgi:hypothetical protein
MAKLVSTTYGKRNFNTYGFYQLDDGTTIPFSDIRAAIFPPFKWSPVLLKWIQLNANS